MLLLASIYMCKNGIHKGSVTARVIQQEDENQTIWLHSYTLSHSAGLLLKGKCLLLAKGFGTHKVLYGSCVTKEGPKVEKHETVLPYMISSDRLITRLSFNKYLLALSYTVHSRWVYGQDIHSFIQIFTEHLSELALDNVKGIYIVANEMEIQLTGGRAHK